VNTDPALDLELGIPGDAVPARLREALAWRAAEEGVLDLAYTTIDSPVGPLLLVASEAGLLRLAFRGEGHDRVLDHLSAVISPRVLRAPDRLATVARQLDEYFARQRREFDLNFDLRLSRGFRRSVLDQLQRIAYGRTASYAAVAQAAGNPAAVRAVGTACATNPLPLVIPCHRVVRSDGTIGNYGGGPEAKRLLLDLESG
jgi:methylated-DNA-[protein]-cysteine S-methyltransferase